MSLETLLQWARHTLNFWWGCVEVSEACRDCYARELDKMRGGNFDNGKTHWGKHAPRWLRVEKAVKDAERMNRLAINEGGERPRVFINSMSDTFEDHPMLPEARAVLFATIERLTACNWLLLTKRPENIYRMAPASWLMNWPDHVWVGTTVENQKRLNERWDHIRNIPAAVIFFSAEPLLEGLNFNRVEVKAPGAGGTCYLDIMNGAGCSVGGSWPTRKVDWVICGGESGSKARPFDLAWAREMRDQCKAGGIPFFLKQLGTVPMELESDWRGRVVTRTLNFRNRDRVPAGFVPLKFHDGHGGNWDEWPADLRVREVPRPAEVRT